MQVGFRYIAMVLIAALGGGAQACIALCGVPVVPVRALAAAPEKSACHHCPVNAPGKPAPAPEGPCKQCQVSVLDRVAGEQDHSVVKAAVELNVAPLLDVLPSAPAPVKSVGLVREPVHPPPGERLHEFCLLLI